MKVTRIELTKIINTCPAHADLNYLNVSGITDMSHLFHESKFNGNISDWDVSNVTNMSFMFRWSKFSNDISKWDVSNVTKMRHIFYNSKFKGDIKDWNLVKCNDDVKLKNYSREKHLRYLKANRPEYFFS